MSTETMERTGRCQCGAVRYVLTAPPRAIYVCHCTECRRQSSSAFGISVYMASADVRLVQGRPRTWSRPGARHGTVECSFCGACGSRLWHVGVDETGITSVKGGTLDDPVDLGGAVHIWTRSRLPGVVIPPDAVQYPEEPDREAGTFVERT